MKRKLVATCAAVSMAAVGVAFASTADQAMASVTGAISTTTNLGAGTGFCLNGGPGALTSDPTNCNLYNDKADVWLSGLPGPAGLADGTYFFAVLAPGGQPDPNDGSPKNLSMDAYTDREFTVAGGVLTSIGTHDAEGSKIQLAPYADTPNPGGVYIAAVCSLADGYPVAKASQCKYDAFKVQSSVPPGPGPVFSDPTVTKTASGSYDTTWTWGIGKSVDQTKITKIGPSSATFNYTVTVTHDSGTNSSIEVQGVIDVENPNFMPDFTIAPLTLSSVSDQLSDGTVCSVDTTGGLVLTQFDNYFKYTCYPLAVPEGQLDNVATATWGAQDLENGASTLDGSANFTFSDVPMIQTKIDDFVTVSDSYAGTLGTVSASDPSPTYFYYSRTVNVGNSGCTTYPNTATSTTNTTGTVATASQSVQACGINSGALTIGFWQNKNGQGIIAGQAKTGVCPSATWLRQYAPFQDLSATATCSQVGSYVANVIKAASAAGTSMNPMLKAQMLATALDVYFSDPGLGGKKISAPVPIGGLVVDLTKVCKMIDGSGGTGTCSGTYENASGAFGGATQLSVSGLLTYAASQSNAGGSSWYGQVKATQGLAKDTFDAINNAVAYLI